MIAEQPIGGAAARMVDMLLHLLDGASPVGMQELWPARLIPRASDGPPAHDRRPQSRKRMTHSPGGNRDATEETGV